VSNCAGSDYLVECKHFMKLNIAAIGWIIIKQGEFIKCVYCI
jgi:hypothetical protein